MKILIAVPSPEYVHNEFSLHSLPALINWSRQQLPDCTLAVKHQPGPKTDLNRNIILAEAIQDPALDFILWLDADMLYPQDMLVRYLDVIRSGIVVDVMGCLYFRRAYPYDAVAYEKTGDALGPYRPISPAAVKENRIYEVDAIGYGGMLVHMSVYKRLGQKCWTRYSSNFHMPPSHPGRLTHDVQFCEDVKAAGMSVKLHGGVRPAHLYLVPLTIEDWRRATYDRFEFFKEPPVVDVIIPSADARQAEAAAQLMQERAGAACRTHVVAGLAQHGYGSLLNRRAAEVAPQLLVYAAEDARPGHDWLKHALMTMVISNAGLVALHDGRWRGEAALFGLLNMTWLRSVYEGEVFYPGYFSHLGADELTRIAKQQGGFCYADRAVMLAGGFEQPDRFSQDAPRADQNLFAERLKSGFDGRVTDPVLLTA